MSVNELIVDPLRLLAREFALFLPRMFGCVLILLVGWLVALLVRRLMLRLFGMLRVDELSNRAGMSEALRRGAVRLTLAELLSQLMYWIIVVATVIVSLQFLGISVAAEWLERFGYLVPRVVVSVVIFLFGMLIASFLGASVRAASLNAGFPQGRAIGEIVYAAVVLLTTIVALEQLEIVTRTIEVALYILLGSFGLAFALAVGLGAEDTVKHYLAELRERWKTPQR